MWRNVQGKEEIAKKRRDWPSEVHKPTSQPASFSCPYFVGLADQRTVDCAYYCQLLEVTKPLTGVKDLVSHMRRSHSLHLFVLTQEKLKSMHLETLCNPDLSPRDYSLLVLLKGFPIYSDQLREDLVRSCLLTQPQIIYEQGSDKIPNRLENWLERGGEYVYERQYFIVLFYKY